MSLQILKAPFTIGQELTAYELQTAYTAIHGSNYPPGTSEHKLARVLSENFPDKFEFEVNKIRGFAWEHPTT